jgi:hypothetical protein
MNLAAARPSNDDLVPTQEERLAFRWLYGINGSDILHSNVLVAASSVHYSKKRIKARSENQSDPAF